MKIIRFFVLLLIPSHLIGYSHQCATSHITTFSEPNDLYHLNLDNNLRNQDNVSFAVRNFNTNTSVLDIISFQLISENDNVKFYGEINEINNGNIDTDIIDQLFQDFVDTDYTIDELGTFKGIKNALEEMLGLPPLINNSRAVNVLFLDIRDGYSLGGEFMAGYFDPQDQFLCLRNINGQYLWLPDVNESSCPSPYNWITNGNGSNIIYVDTNPASVSPEGYSDILFTLTHEYQHLLHWNSDIKEGYFGSEASGWAFHNPWINEGLSDLMPSILGIGKRDFSTFLENPLIGLDQWSEPGSSSTLKYYAKSALFFQYLYERNGFEVIKNIFNDNEQGISSIKSKYTSDEFTNLFMHWIQSLIKMKLPSTEIDGSILITNLSEYVSIGNSIASIEINYQMPKYSFSSYEIPSYLFIDDIYTDDDRSILIFDGLSLQSDKEFLFHHSQNIDNIIFFTEDETLPNTTFTLSYTHSSSPSSKNLFIYPNPITDKDVSITYFSNDINDVLYIKMYDLLGKVVLSTSIDSYNNYYYSGNFNVNLPSGIYIVKAFGSNVENEFEIVTIAK